MKLKLRPLPLIISIVASSVLLFGGWFVYNSMALNNPLAKIVNEIDGVNRAETQVLRNEVKVDLTLDEEASLREVIQQLKAEGSSLIGQRELTVSVNDNSSPELERWWSSVLFDIAEAMEHKQYSQIPTTLELHKGELAGLHFATEMDEQHVYIKLVHDDYSKFIMLPRTPNMMGVWSND